MTTNALAKLIKGFLGFVCSILLCICIAVPWCYITLLDGGTALSTIDVQFYPELYSEVVNELTLQTVSAGVPEELIVQPVTEAQIQEEFDASFIALLNGEQYEPSFDALTEEYKRIFIEYADTNNLEFDEKNISELSESCISTIEKCVKIPFSGTISKYTALLNRYLPIALTISFVLMAALGWFIFKMCMPRVEALVYYGRAALASGIIGVLVSFYVTINVSEENIKMDSAAYKLAALNIIDSSFDLLLAASVFIGVIGIALLIYGVIASDAVSTEIE